MEQQQRSVKLYGRILLDMDIRALTGLRVGGAPADLTIGGLDKPVIRNPLNQQPYIPGSSLRGKMRSLWEKSKGAVQNQAIRTGTPSVYIHTLENNVALDNDEVCRIFGVTGDVEVPNPTRLVVHDAFLTPESARLLETVAQTDQPYTETKWEAAIDRVTSAAVPRQMERVPAGVAFQARLAYSVFGTQYGQGMEDIRWFFDVLRMLLLVEDDYLGSSGSRGSGRVKFENLRLVVRSSVDYGAPMLLAPEPVMDVQSLIDSADALFDHIYALLQPQM